MNPLYPLSYGLIVPLLFFFKDSFCIKYPVLVDMALVAIFMLVFLNTHIEDSLSSVGEA